MVPYSVLTKMLMFKSSKRRFAVICLLVYYAAVAQGPITSVVRQSVCPSVSYGLNSKNKA